MSDIALYRKYRPLGFDSVLGQEHIVDVLRGALKDKNISHAYLFSGSRGTGKTTIARIMARELGTTEKDLYEIDAASNRGIDDIRELRESVQTLPFESEFKVYIIDEVHMLTKEAFNALLKTLEEPPKHVKFILATTEAEKLPDTVRSRCQSFVFKKPTQKTLTDMVTTVGKGEGYTLEPAAAELIALLGDGSFRDTHGVLQKVLSSSTEKKITAEAVATVTGAPSSLLVNDILTALDQRDVAAAITAITQSAEANTDMKLLLTMLLQKMRAIMLLRFAPELKDSIEEHFTDTDIKLLGELAGNKTSAINSKTLAQFLEAYNQLGQSAIQQLPLELALINVLGEE